MERNQNVAAPFQALLATICPTHANETTAETKRIGLVDGEGEHHQEIENETPTRDHQPRSH
jgi:hypothetical protein